ncbi:SDR family oxidoreductase [Rhodococcus sp. B7740]|uniref:SDR family oxidoreductase n=1 Tax=Rhodococcus sp. B7740 TaxID=1564114 RepID=UPI000B2DE2EB|nr:SDR family oxidoreductase [Rhodococcus sp. B7740]
MSVTFFITGGTGFLGRRVVQEILDRDPSATIYVLVRAGSLDRVASHHRVLPIIGDLTEPGLGIDDGVLPDRLDHVVHLGAVYDLTAGDDQATTNVQGTREVALLALRTGAVMHHVSSIESFMKCTTALVTNRRFATCGNDWVVVYSKMSSNRPRDRVSQTRSRSGPGSAEGG